MAFPYQETVLTLKDSNPVQYLFVSTPSTQARFLANLNVFHISCKFIFERASSGAANGLVHIRGFNNRYLARRGNSCILILGGEKREEDVSKTSCTLFRATVTDVGGKKIARFVHVQLGRAVGRYPAGHVNVDRLGVEEPANMIDTQFNLINLANLVKLPRRVMFKGNNNKYMCHRSLSNRNHNMFADAEVGEDETKDYLVHTKANGDIELLSRKAGKFLIRAHSDNWVVSHSPANNPDPCTLFEVIKTSSSNKIILRNKGNDKFCLLKTINHPNNVGFSATANSTVADTHLIVVEPVIERRIRVERLHLEHALIYNQKLVAKVERTKTNTTNTVDVYDLDFNITTNDTSSWSASNSRTMSFKFSFTTGIPKIGLGTEVSVQGEYSEEYEWGKQITKIQKIGATHSTAVPANTRRKVTMVMKEATFDVPFSYTQADRYTDGTWEVTYHNDGVYTGTNAYTFYYESRDEPLTSLALGLDEDMSANLVATDSGIIDTTDMALPPIEEPEYTIDSFDDYESDIVEPALVQPSQPPACIADLSETTTDNPQF